MTCKRYTLRPQTTCLTAQYILNKVDQILLLSPSLYNGVVLNQLTISNLIIDGRDLPCLTQSLLLFGKYQTFKYIQEIKIKIRISNTISYQGI